MEAGELGDCGWLTRPSRGLVMSQENRGMSQVCHQDHRGADSHEDVVGQA